MAGTNGQAPEEAPELHARVDCICPDGGHGAEGDTITFRPTLGYTAVRAVRYAGAIAQEDDPEATIASLMAVMNEGFILHGIESWTLREKGKPVPVEPGTIRRLVLANTVAALIVGDYADALYQPQVLIPFSGTGRAIIAAFADGRIDLAAERTALDVPVTGHDGSVRLERRIVEPVREAPEAVEAILDYHYPDGLHRNDYVRLRWRLYVLAELGVGYQLRRSDAAQVADEKRAMAAMARG